jgi:hypothetical protein
LASRAGWRVADSGVAVPVALVLLFSVSWFDPIWSKLRR